jgi:hypothetical protein
LLAPVSDQPCQFQQLTGAPQNSERQLSFEEHNLPCKMQNGFEHAWQPKCGWNLSWQSETKLLEGLQPAARLKHFRRNY